jgi:hypothetical protein
MACWSLYYWSIAYGYGGRGAYSQKKERWPLVWRNPAPKMVRFMSMTMCGVHPRNRDLVSRTASQAHYSKLNWGREIVQYWENGISFDRREQGHLARAWGVVLSTYKDIRRQTWGCGFPLTLNYHRTRRIKRSSTNGGGCWCLPTLGRWHRAVMLQELGKERDSYRTFKETIILSLAVRSKVLMSLL